MPGIIAIVGRPNVGKSALFNRIIRRRIAIVHDMPGVTRDRISAEAEWGGHPFTLVDTGGIGLLRGEKTGDVLEQAAYTQVQVAMESADAIIFVVDAKEGLVPLDREVAARLHKCAKPVIVAVNKVDDKHAEGLTDEFARLGFPKVVAVSALHGHGVEMLVQAALVHLPAPVIPEPRPVGEAPLAGPIKLAIVGKPNVGKSSIINALTQSERVIVSPIPGTTRDSVDVPFEVESEGRHQRYVLIDTAGLRKRRRIDDTVEFFSVQRSEESIARCDIVIFVLDAESGITEQDKKIADLIVENRRACVVVINKWDLFKDAVIKANVEKKAAAKPKNRDARRASDEPTTLGEFGAWVQEKLFFLDYAPVIFTSAVTRFNLDRLLDAVRYVEDQLQQKIPTALLNRVLREAIDRRQPISSMGHFLKFFYATQVRQSPPTFLLFLNRDELLSPAYAKHLTGEMRKAFGYEGCPILLVAKPRPKTDEKQVVKRRSRR